MFVVVVGIAVVVVRVEGDMVVVAAVAVDPLPLPLPLPPPLPLPLPLIPPPASLSPPSVGGAVWIDPSCSPASGLFARSRNRCRSLFVPSRLLDITRTF